MRTIVIGLGIQGAKRCEAAGDDLVATVDPAHNKADFAKLEDVPLDIYDAAMLCTPDSVKLELMNYLLSNGKHVLVEKPMIAEEADLRRLDDIAHSQNLACYTAYNHRFEPAITQLKQVLDSGDLGTIYSARLYYGNGTARNVRDSLWRDTGSGVLRDLGSHLLDLTQYLLPCSDYNFHLDFARHFENKAYDHAAFTAHGETELQFEVSLLSWKNEFTIDLYGEGGSAHIQSLCKWGPSTFTLRRRVLPSGRPQEETEVFQGPDRTWPLEYDAFKALCAAPQTTLKKDIWIAAVLRDLLQQTKEKVEL